MLMRDRLLSNYTVKPVMARIRTSLLTSSAAAVLSVIVLNAAPRPLEYQSTLQSSQPGITRYGAHILQCVCHACVVTFILGTG